MDIIFIISHSGCSGRSDQEGDPRETQRCHRTTARYLGVCHSPSVNTFYFSLSLSSISQAKVLNNDTSISLSLSLYFFTSQSSFLNNCSFPRSSFVWRHLLRYRQDLLDKYLDAGSAFRGVFYGLSPPKKVRRTRDSLTALSSRSSRLKVKFSVGACPSKVIYLPSLSTYGCFNGLLVHAHTLSWS